MLYFSRRRERGREGGEEGKGRERGIEGKRETNQRFASDAFLNHLVFATGSFPEPGAARELQGCPELGLLETSTSVNFRSVSL